MEALFGLPTQWLAFGLVGTLVSMLAVLARLALKRGILVKLGVRNIPKRPAQSLVIVFGLMLSTVIIAASLGIGDTITHSIRLSSLGILGHTDEVIGPSRLAVFGGGYLPEGALDEVRSKLEGDDRIDGLMPGIEEILPFVSPRTRLTEARTRILGYDPAAQDGFGKIHALDGTEIRLSDLAPNQVFLNQDATEQLKAKAGDRLVIYAPTDTHTVWVKALVKNGGLPAGGGNYPAALMRLESVQDLLGQEGKITRILVSNRGGIEGGLDLSTEVTKSLRIAFTDRQVAQDLFALLREEDTDTLLLAEATDDGVVAKEFRQDLLALAEEVSRDEMSDEFVSLVADQPIVDELVETLERKARTGLAPKVGALAGQLVRLNVDDVKADRLRYAESQGNEYISLFSVFGSVSIIVGLLLIFLVFVVLAASRTTEMGMVRAVGLKRSHLVQIFTFEGTAYAFSAAIAGTALGAAVSLVLVRLLQSAVSAEQFIIFPSFTLRSGLIAFCAGMILTVVTVVVSAYRVSRLNIVVAIRGLSEEFVREPPTPVRPLVMGVLRALVAPIALVVDAWCARKRGMDWIPPVVLALALVLLISLAAVSESTRGLAAPAALVWGGWFLVAVARLAALYLKHGWPVVLAGAVVAAAGIVAEQVSTFNIGVSIAIIGVGLILRRALLWANVRKHLVARIAATFEGGVLLAFWSLPLGALEPYTGELKGGPEIFAIGGTAMVAAAVWLLMNNTQVLLWVLNLVLGRMAGLKAVLKIAVAHPMSSKFITGLTVAMFSMIIFTLTIFAVLNNLGNMARDYPERVTGGYDIRATISPDLPIATIQEGLSEGSELPGTDYQGYAARWVSPKVHDVASSVTVPVEARQVGAGDLKFSNLEVRAVDRTFFLTNELQFSHYDPSYGKDARDIWIALAADHTLAVLNNSSLVSDDPFATNFGGFKVDGFKASDPQRIESFEVEVRPQGSDEKVVRRRVIGVLDPLADFVKVERPSTLITGDSILAEVSDVPIPFTTFDIRRRGKGEEGVFDEDVASLLETAFLDHSMVAVSTKKEIERSMSQDDAFNRVFQGFMGLGLVVGVAAIGVLSFRAVEDRRQSIGILRAIGFKVRAIQVQFLLEASFVTLLGTALGLGLGGITSWNIFSELSKEVEGLSFSVPWVNLAVIVAVAWFFSVLTTVIPARQAGRIYPAVALRYE